MDRFRRLRVLIAGGGVAGLETLLALRALAAEHVEMTILAPELKFANRSMSVAQPFEVQRGRGVRLEAIAAEVGARWHRGALDRVMHGRHRVVTRDREELPYDMLVLATGAHPKREWQSQGTLTYHGGRDGPNYRLLLHQLCTGRVRSVAFVKPAGASWPLPLYDLALLTAAHCAANDRQDVELSLVTPEDRPLAIFGNVASAAISRILRESGVALHTSSYGRPSSPGRLDISPGHRFLTVDRIVTEPRLVGPSLRGIPCGREGFIPTDAHGRVPGLDGVFAAGDATTFPIKQGGLAAQQADAVAEAIAALAGAGVDPQPFRPVLRGTLLTGGPARYLRADISGRTGDDSIMSAEALWWPPNKLCGRYLAPYLSSRTGEAADVMPQDGAAIPVHTAIDPGLLATASHFGELCDLPPRAAADATQADRARDR
jgi:sulfide:quinone oxidoreductase